MLGPERPGGHAPGWGQLLISPYVAGPLKWAHELVDLVPDRVALGVAQTRKQDLHLGEGVAALALADQLPYIAEAVLAGVSQLPDRRGLPARGVSG